MSCRWVRLRMRSVAEDHARHNVANAICGRQPLAVSGRQCFRCENGACLLRRRFRVVAPQKRTVGCSGRGEAHDLPHLTCRRSYTPCALALPKRKSLSKANQSRRPQVATAPTDRRLYAPFLHVACPPRAKKAHGIPTATMCPAWRRHPRRGACRTPHAQNQKLTEMLVDSDITKCQHRAGMKSVSPGSSTACVYSAVENSG